MRGNGVELETNLSRSAAWKRLRAGLPSPYRLRGNEDGFRIEPAWGPDPESVRFDAREDEQDPRSFCVTFRGSLATHNGRVRLCGTFQEPRWFRLTARLVLVVGSVVFGASLLAMAVPGSISRSLLPGVFPSGAFLLFMFLGFLAGRRHYARERADLEKHLRQLLSERLGKG
jgi:hypothetical protein